MTDKLQLGEISKWGKKSKLPSKFKRTCKREPISSTGTSKKDSRIIYLSTEETTSTRQKKLPSLSLAQNELLQGYFLSVSALTQTISSV